MLNNEPNRISLSGESYAIKCSLLVLEKIQDKYGDVSAFEDKIIVFEKSDEEGGIKVRYPDPEAVCDAKKENPTKMTVKKENPQK